jgi:hypothetical protein
MPQADGTVVMRRRDVGRVLPAGAAAANARGRSSSTTDDVVEVRPMRSASCGTSSETPGLQSTPAPASGGAPTFSLHESGHREAGPSQRTTSGSAQQLSQPRTALGVLKDSHGPAGGGSAAASAAAAAGDATASAGEGESAHGPAHTLHADAGRPRGPSAMDTPLLGAATAGTPSGMLPVALDRAGESAAAVAGGAGPGGTGLTPIRAATAASQGAATASSPPGSVTSAGSPADAPGAGTRRAESSVGSGTVTIGTALDGDGRILYSASTAHPRW